MWTLSNSNLGNTIINNSTVKGLELTELSNNNSKAQLFKYQPLKSYGVSFSSTPGNASPSANTGITPVIDTTTVLTPNNTFYLYCIDYIWNINSLTKVVSINFLEENSYTHYLDKTYILVNETITNLTLNNNFYTYLSRPNSSYTYELDLSALAVENFTITEAIVSGLRFTSGGNLSFLFDSPTLYLNANAICRPQPNDIVEVNLSKDINVSNLEGNIVYEFDLEPLNISSASYLEFGGNSYTENRNLNSGSLFNNFINKKAYAIK